MVSTSISSAAVTLTTAMFDGVSYRLTVLGYSGQNDEEVEGLWIRNICHGTGFKRVLEIERNRKFGVLP